MTPRWNQEPGRLLLIIIVPKPCQFKYISDFYMWIICQIATITHAIHIFWVLITSTLQLEYSLGIQNLSLIHSYHFFFLWLKKSYSYPTWQYNTSGISNVSQHLDERSAVVKPISVMNVKKLAICLCKKKSWIKLTVHKKLKDLYSSLISTPAMILLYLALQGPY